MSQKILLKDLLFNQQKIERMAEEIRRVYPSFATGDFVREVVEKFPVLELKARITWIAECLRVHLPSDYAHAVSILLQALPAPNNPELSDNDFGDFLYAAYAEYVAKNGCTQERLAVSLQALYEITKRFSVEDAIRYFLNAFPRETFKKLQSWVRDPHYHVRRLCSEGTRPKLPWSQKISLSVTESLPLLDVLFCDHTRFVTRSVANHINDISKIDADLALGTLQQWEQSGQQTPDEMKYLLRHGLRTLMKQGHPKALALLGFRSTAHVTLSDFVVPGQVCMDTALVFSFVVQSQKTTNALIDYAITFQGKNGILKHKKVFKLKTFSLLPQAPVCITKRHLFRKNMTTRRLYPGQHTIEIQINGKQCAQASFVLQSG